MIDSDLNISNSHKVISKYSDYLILKQYSPNTSKSYLSSIDEFIYFLQKNRYYHFSQIDKNTFNKYIRFLKNDSANLSNRAVNIRIAAINNFSKFICSRYNCCELKKIKQLKFISTMPNILDPNDILLLFKNKNPVFSKEATWVCYRDYAVAIFCYSSGARISEALSIDSLDLNDNWVRLEKTKNMHTRYVPINLHVHIAISYYKEQCPYCLYRHLWVCSRGRKLKSPAASVGIKKMFGFSPHYFRHAFATHLILNGCDLLTVKEFLGHSSISTTSIYTHIKPNHLRETVIKCHPLSRS